VAAGSATGSAGDTAGIGRVGRRLCGDQQDVGSAGTQPSTDRKDKIKAAATAKGLVGSRAHQPSEVGERARDRSNGTASENTAHTSQPGNA
jgi:hypothetical protein